MGQFPKQFVYLTIGLMQGLVLALLLNDSVVNEHPVLLSPFFITALLLPLVFYCSELAHTRRRLWILGLAAVALFAIGIYQGVTMDAASSSDLFDAHFQMSHTLALAIFVGIPALSVSATTWEDRYHRWVTALGWLASVPMLIVAFYGLVVRVLEYGLTPDRIWGLFTAFVIAIFVFGYAAHSAQGLRQGQGRKTLISRTHRVATFALVAGIALMQIGIADPRWRLRAQR
ncbi:hypothetical protein FACS1894101_1740 [Betaproteobacteria bacterium]|nr:hypothetical protein FACS1894101_1740 [Betaproteobacteria bacterium]